tara:strand:+ start:629 stop:763 length:135 start_codon:yes stop_codon:yes gene_type:complete
MINILVTGSDGFIGKNLCSHLSEKGKYNIFKFGKKIHFQSFIIF